MGLNQGRSSRPNNGGHTTRLEIQCVIHTTLKQIGRLIGRANEAPDDVRLTD